MSIDFLDLKGLYREQKTTAFYHKLRTSIVVKLNSNPWLSKWWSVIHNGTRYKI